MQKKKIGIIGCGYWGPNLLRNFYFHPNAEIVRVCDLSKERLDANKKMYPSIQITQNYKEITQAKDIDAVIVATPVSTHYEVAKDALLNGKDVLCEKPLTVKVSESEELIDIAAKKELILMAGHVFVFNTGILKLKEILKYKDCGDPYYLYAQRTNLGIVRKDVSAVYDLASHDIYIFNFLLDATPRVLSAVGHCYLQPNLEDVVFIALEYPGDILAHIHVSWLDPKKIREITVVGNKKMVTFNDLFGSKPIEIYSKTIEKHPYPHDYGEFQLLAKEGEILIPHVKPTEPLKAQVEHFMECIEERKKPICDGKAGLDVVKTLEEVDNILSKSRKVGQSLQSSPLIK